MLKLSIAIIGATMIDGSGGPPIKDAVVVFEGDSIVAVGRRGRVKIPAEAQVIDARGMVVAPGFIDAHNHSDRGFTSDPGSGVTSVAGNYHGCNRPGRRFILFPLVHTLSNLDQNPIALNVLTFVGHATLRSRVMGEDTNRQATAGRD